MQRQLIGQTAFPPEGTRPGKPTVRPHFRPDVPCETQQTPDLNAPRGDADATVVPHPLPISALPAADQLFQREAGAELGRLEGALARQRQGLPYVSPLGVSDKVEAKELARIGFQLTPQGKIVPKKKGAGR